MNLLTTTNNEGELKCSFYVGIEDSSELINGIGQRLSRKRVHFYHKMILHVRLSYFTVIPDLKVSRSISQSASNGRKGFTNVLAVIRLGHVLLRLERHPG